MRGVNIVRMNAMSVRDAIQEYLNKRSASQKADYVTCIKVKDKYVEEFEVYMKGTE